MVSKKRRGFLTTAGMVLVAGCGGTSGTNNIDSSDSADSEASDDRDGDGVPDGQDDFPDDSQRSVEKVLADDWRQLKEDQYISWPLTPDSPFHLEWEFVVRSGPAVDFMMMDQSEFSSFEDKERFKYYPELSALDSTGSSGGGDIPAGDYRIVIDNSNRGKAKPPTNFDDDVIKVEFTFVASR